MLDINKSNNIILSPRKIKNPDNIEKIQKNDLEFC